jgi:uncharacterized protein YcgL (UPF0745 family)
VICFVYRSEKKQGAYLYLAREKTLDDVPEDLMNVLGKCVQVMQLDLAKRAQLASQDIELVKENLIEQGYHLQIPPKITTGVINYRV